MTFDFTSLLKRLGDERNDLEIFISEHKGLGPAYTADAHARIGVIDRTMDDLYRARREQEAT